MPNPNKNFPYKIILLYAYRGFCMKLISLTVFQSRLSDFIGRGGRVAYTLWQFVVGKIVLDYHLHLLKKPSLLYNGKDRRTID